MIGLYFNSETGAAHDAESGINSIVRASDVLRGLESHIKGYYFDERIADIASFPIFNTNIGDAQYLADALRTANKAGKESIKYLLDKLGKGEKIHIDSEELGSLWILEEVNAPSELLQSVAMHNGMVLSFATDAVWERDFISFTERPEKVPNIWGQDSLDSINEWIKDCYTNQDTPLRNIAREHQAVICMNCLKDNDLIKKFGETEIGPLLEVVVTGRIRIFISYKGEEIFIGGKYIKGQGEERAAQNATAKKAKSKINAHINNIKST